MGRLTGIGVYIQQLVRQAKAENQDIDWYFPYPLNWKGLLFPGAICRNLSLGERLSVRCLPQWDKAKSGRLSCDRFDLYHVTNSVNAFEHFDMPYVITVHDLAWKRVPVEELPKPKIRGLEKLDALIRGARHVICDSECTRQDVMEFIGRAEEHTSTVHLAPRPGFQPPTDEAQRDRVQQKYTGGRPFFFSVSTIEPRKNYVRLVKAFARYCRENDAALLMIAGIKGQGWPELAQEIESLGVQNHVRVLGRVADQTVKDLMLGCQALLYPSLYEGFGIPALEAMAMGTPVICSSAGSLAEIIGDAAFIVDPLDVDSIYTQIAEFAAGKHDLAQVRLRCLEQAAKFNWCDTARNTVEIYRKILS